MSPLKQALRVRAFRRILFATTLSHLGTWLQITAASWVMLEATGSSVLVGLVTASGIIPQTVLAIPGGVLADRRDRRFALMIGNAVAAVAAAVLALTPLESAATPAIIISTMLVIGVATSITQPSGMTYIPDLVGRPLMGGAIAAQSMSYNVAKVLGPGLGALMVANDLAPAAFALNAISFAGVALALRFAPADEAEKHPPGRTGLTRRAFGYAMREAPIRHPLIVTGLFGFTGMCFQTLMGPLIAAEGADAGIFGALLLIFGAGGIVGAATRGRLAVRAGSADTALGVGVLGICAFVLAAAPLAPTAYLASLIGGASWVWTHNATQKRVQLNAPFDLRGRLVAMYSLATFGPLSIGILLAGWFADRTSPALAVALIAGSNAAFGLALGVRAYLRRHIRSELRNA